MFLQQVKDVNESGSTGHELDKHNATITSLSDLQSSSGTQLPRNRKDRLLKVCLDLPVQKEPGKICTASMRKGLVGGKSITAEAGFKCLTVLMKCLKLKRV